MKPRLKWIKGWNWYWNKVTSVYLHETAGFYWNSLYYHVLSRYLSAPWAWWSLLDLWPPLTGWPVHSESLHCNLCRWLSLPAFMLLNAVLMTSWSCPSVLCAGSDNRNQTSSSQSFSTLYISSLPGIWWVLIWRWWLWFSWWLNWNAYAADLT